MLSVRIRSCLGKAYTSRTASRHPSSSIALIGIIPSCSILQTFRYPVCHAEFAPTMPKRKSSSLAHEPPITTVPIPPPTFGDEPPPKRRASGRKPSTIKPKPSMSTNPDINANVLDAPGPLRASPDASESEDQMDIEKAGMDVEKQVKNEDEDVPSFMNGADSESSLSDMSDVESPVKAKAPAKGAKAGVPTKKKTDGVEAGKAAPKQNGTAKAKKESSKEPQFLDPENEGLEEADEEEIQAALSRPPPVNSDYLPLPWRGRIGYVSSCNRSVLNRTDTPRLASAPIFASPILPSSPLEPAA